MAVHQADVCVIGAGHGGRKFHNDDQIRKLRRWPADRLRTCRPRPLINPAVFSAMGYGVPAAIGAKQARPDVNVVGIVGDGALLMTGMELITRDKSRVVGRALWRRVTG